METNLLDSMGIADRGFYLRPFDSEMLRLTYEKGGEERHVGYFTQHATSDAVKEAIKGYLRDTEAK